MITKMTGTLNRVLDEEARLQVGPFEYQVLIPECVRRQIQTRTGERNHVSYPRIHRGEPNSNPMIPRRIGFMAEAELEFFELFCTVDKIGVEESAQGDGPADQGNGRRDSTAGCEMADDDARHRQTIGRANHRDAQEQSDQVRDGGVPRERDGTAQCGGADRRNGFRGCLFGTL